MPADMAQNNWLGKMHTVMQQNKIEGKMHTMMQQNKIEDRWKLPPFVPQSVDIES